MISGNSLASDEDIKKTVFQSYAFQNNDYKAALAEKTREVYKHIFPDCTQSPSVGRLKPTMLSYFATPQSPSKHPLFGQWQESLVITACDRKERVNLLAVAYNADIVPVIFPLITGRTEIDVNFLSIAESKIAEALMIEEKCQDFQNTLKVSFYGYRSRNGNSLTRENQNLGWYENWLVQACDKTYDINLAVLPDSDTKYRFVAKIKK